MIGQPSGRRRSLTRIAAVYTVAIGAAAAWFFTGPSTRLWLDGLIADLIATLVIFAASRVHHNSSMYDAYWSVLPPLLTIGWWIRSDTGVDDARGWCVLAVVCLWSVRLTGNWLTHFTGLHHEDWRYRLLRDRAGRAGGIVDLIGIHVVPTLQVFAGMLPVYVVVTRTERDVGWLDVIAVIVGLAAVTVSWVADRQLTVFARAGAEGHTMDRGLWAWSRHPNYFGEFGFWFALALFGLSAAPSTWWWVFLGAAGIYAMFAFASIPMMEHRSLERRPEYAEVIARVPRFVPRPPRRS